MWKPLIKTKYKYVSDNMTLTDVSTNLVRIEFDFVINK